MKGFRIPMRASHTSPLKQFQTALKKLPVDAFLQPVNDAFLGEYPAAPARRLEWVSGFSGSAGLGIITAEKSVLLVDGRYTLQAPQQVNDPAWACADSAVMKPAEWLVENLPQGAVVGVDGWLHSMAYVKRLKSALESHALSLHVLEQNPVDAVWVNRPQPEHSMPFAMPLERAGRSAAAKLEELRRAMAASQVEGYFLANAESVNWLLNVRGFDVDTTPVWHVMAYVPLDGDVQLFTPHVAPDEVPIDVPHQLHTLAQISDVMPLFQGKKVGLDVETTPAILEQLLWPVSQVPLPDPTALPRACKNPVEVAGMKAAHERDGKALTRAIAWIKEECAAGRHPSEMEVADVVLAHRKQNEDFLIPSFDTIAGFGPNGAIVHYRPEEKTNLTLKDGSLLLLDSGGQYLDGTTDVTRTIAIGTPSAEMVYHNTLVLKGHIGLARARFPQGTTGAQLDALARTPLWNAGLDYAHGTGHGVGHCLNVHEGPQGISKRYGQVPLVAGMVLSNEPGFYKTGEYGIRIENLVVVRECEDKPGFLEFETITRVPLDETLIDRALLSADEIAWLDAYQAWAARVGAPLGASSLRQNY